MIVDPRGFLVWACKVAGLVVNKPDEPLELSRPAQALVLSFIDGYSNYAIGAEMGISAHQAARYVRESLEVLAVQEWTPDEIALFEELKDKVDTRESTRQHFSALLDAIRNSQDPTPRSVEYDANGRQIGGRSPLVDVDTAMDACRFIGTYPAKMRKDLTPKAVCP